MSKSTIISLQSLQKSFVQQLIKPEQENDFLQNLTTSGNLNPAQQLAIYQANMHSALQQTLAQIYPVCYKIVGEKYFKQLARYYINAYPSKDSNLNYYGEIFCDFLLEQCQQRSELVDFSYLADLVKLEWFYHTVYYAAEGAIFDLSAFAQLTTLEQEQCTFTLAPQLRFIASDYPILSIWKLNQQGENQQDKNQQEISKIKGEKCCVFRARNNLKITPIDDLVYQLLDRIKKGETLEKISQTNAVNHLSELIQSAWITGFKIPHVQ